MEALVITIIIGLTIFIVLMLWACLRVSAAAEVYWAELMEKIEPAGKK